MQFLPVKPLSAIYIYINSSSILQSTAHALFFLFFVIKLFITEIKSVIPHVITVGQVFFLHKNGKKGEKGVEEKIKINK